MNKRPMPVTIFGILNIGFALFGILGVLISVVFSSSSAMAGNPFMQKLYGNPQYAAWIKINTPLGGIAALALLAAGIGLLLMQNWARVLSIGYGIFAILQSLVGGIVTFFVVVPLLREGSTPFFMLIGSVIGLIFALVYPVLLIIFMMRPNVVAALRPAPPLP